MIKNNIPDKCQDCNNAIVTVRKDNHYNNGKREPGYDVTIDVVCRDFCYKEDNSVKASMEYGLVYFEIDRSRSKGLLHSSHYTLITFYPYSNIPIWDGTEINSDGWVDLDQEEIDAIVKEYDLEDKAKRIMADEQ